MDEYFRKVLRYANDPVAFARDIIGITVKKFHAEWLRAFERHKYLILLAPRDHGKTVIVGTYIIWRIVRDPDVRILICTVNQSKASDMMFFIQYHLEHNEKLIEYFGEQKGDGEWSKTELRVKRRGKTGMAFQTPTLQVLGVGSSMISAHYDLIILDDVVDENNSKTRYRREALESWYNSTLMEMLVPTGQIIVIGTRWHEDDLYNYLAKKPGYVVKVYKAIIKERTEDQEPVVLWPERYPYDDEQAKKLGLPEGIKTLKFIREHIGETKFAMQYQNEIRKFEGSKIKPDWIDAAIERWRKLDVIPGNLKRYIGVDFASPGKETDYFVICVIGIDEYSDIYVLDCLRTKASLFRQFELIKEMDARWNPVKIGLEATAQQKIITDQLQEISTMPIVPIKSSHVNDRDTRVDRLSILFETNRIYLNPELGHLIDELYAYPRSAHDDCIDALTFAIQAASSGKPVDWKWVVNTTKTSKLWNVKLM